ncbi:hypothetical protein KOR34_52460 [Posidoniimonas corsicana]|uniref:Methane oxygenase PmoA n=1 Tax=Posidoniimonas corsicana TaxID=1938618 RepID=A0A5C5UT25_9BACT|nr:PmoA family protein [Posidoniimonas corsicana]TWT29336.1 hypothetical protein KOR34_52460 [Posidoniimonas corsicana]
MKPAAFILPCLFAAVVVPPVAAEVSVEESPAGAVVKIDGKLFAEYHTRSGHQPAVWPLIGPAGNKVTRGYPMTELGPDEENDHPHHRSLWFAHGIVNGADFWVEPKKEGDALIEHKQFETRQGGDQSGTIVTHNDWVAGGKKLCEDRRTLVFSEPKPGVRLVDFTIELKADEEPVTFGDTKEGTFAVRVAGTMKVDAKQGGRLVNNNGQQDKEAWGRPAAWVDYAGPAEGEQSGLAIFSHPDSFRHPCLWHVRTYGLFAANPFGVHHFPKTDLKQGAVTIEPGESIKLRYLVVLHDGQADQAGVQRLYDELTSR